MLLFLYYLFIKLSSINNISEEESPDVVSYASEVIDLLTIPDIIILDNDFLVNGRLHEWLVSRAETLAKFCNEKESSIFDILEILVNRSYERLESLEHKDKIHYSTMTIDDLMTQLGTHIEILHRLEDSYGNKNLLLTKKKEFSDMFVWNASSMDAHLTNELLHDATSSDEYLVELSVLGEYTNLLIIKIIRNNLDYIKSEKDIFKDLRFP
jgi:hypothetical protein